MAKTFLTAEWRKLLMVNYEIDPDRLLPYLPYKTELDLFQDKCFVSLVGFLFKNVRVKGIPFPFHTTFEEVNLRFYVRYKSGDKWKRGVVFIREIVPRPMISLIANTVYKENYVTRRMRYEWHIGQEALEVSYLWKDKNWQKFSFRGHNRPEKINKGSEEEFITEHYWGYARYAHKITNEYEVVHPKWEVYPMISYDIDVDFNSVYGNKFAFLDKQTPTSVFLAEGSEVEVLAGIKIT